MKFFKSIKQKKQTVLNIGIRECRTCDNNIRCEECAYPRENEMLKAEIEVYDKEIERLKTAYIQVSMDREEAVAEAVKEFWSKLKTHSRKMQSSDFGGEFWDKAILVADGDNILEEMVGE